MDESARKKIDKEWQDKISKEKNDAKYNHESYHQPTFSVFLSSLSMQAMIAMGKLENPLTKQINKNYPQARFLINTLEIIKEKTKNNIDDQEKNLLRESLANLKLMYLEVVNG